MGCDIHWYSETYRDTAWHCDQAGSFTLEGDEADEDNPPYYDMRNFPGCDRDYWFFGLLNGVRYDCAWAFPRQEEIPADASNEVQTLYRQWASDVHSAGSHTRAALKAKLAELQPLRAQALLLPGEGNGEALAHHSERLEEVIAHLSAAVADEHQRIVFWFDN